MIQIIVIVEQKMQQQINTSAAGKTSQCIERKLNNLRFVLYLYAQLYIYKSVYINVCMYLLIELYSLLYLFGTFLFFYFIYCCCRLYVLQYTYIRICVNIDGFKQRHWLRPNRHEGLLRGFIPSACVNKGLCLTLVRIFIDGTRLEIEF